MLNEQDCTQRISKNDICIVFENFAIKDSEKYIILKAAVKIKHLPNILVFNLKSLLYTQYAPMERIIAVYRRVI